MRLQARDDVLLVWSVVFSLQLAALLDAMNMSTHNVLFRNVQWHFCEVPPRPKRVAGWQTLFF